ncbi:MAG TPA: DUF2231 domain-containing protein [Holophagaceae bacterium]|nr:DUF2231 domain-containing protein [Holophagaceae bacterium]
MLPLHPKLVHLPIALAVLMPLLLLGLGLAIRKLWLPQRAWFLALALQGLLLGGGFAARWSGERDEHRVEGRVPEGALKAHEQAANLFLVGAGGVLVLVAAGAFARRPGTSLGLMGASFAGSLLVLGLGYRVGEAGGQLVYGPGGVAGSAGPQGSPAPESNGHDEAREHEGREHP